MTRRLFLQGTAAAAGLIHVRGLWGGETFHRDNRRALRDAYESLVSGGVNGLHYLPGTHLLGDDGEAATDGSHPSDLGFLRYAAAYEEVLRPLLS